MFGRFRGSSGTDEEQDKVLRMAITVVIVLLIIGGIIVTLRMMNPRADIRDGRQKLKELESVDIEAVEARIQELWQAEQTADEEWKNRPVNEKFASSIVLGDSITQGLYEFGVLDESLVIAEKGAEVTRPEETGTLENIRRASEAKPQNLFLAFGMNDIDAVQGDAAVYTDAYKKVLDEIRVQMPDTKIYINCVLPVQQHVIDGNAWYGNIAAFNDSLKELCDAEGITFIDNSSLVLEEYYADDGIHLSPEYYPAWVNNMAEAAGL